MKKTSWGWTGPGSNQTGTKIYFKLKGEVAFGDRDPISAPIFLFLVLGNQFFPIIGHLCAILRIWSLEKFWPFLDPWRPFWIFEMAIWEVRCALIKKCILQKLLKMPFYSPMGQNFNFRMIRAVQGGQNGLKCPKSLKMAQIWPGGHR